MRFDGLTGADLFTKLDKNAEAVRCLLFVGCHLINQEPSQTPSQRDSAWHSTPNALWLTTLESHFIRLGIMDGNIKKEKPRAVVQGSYFLHVAVLLNIIVTFVSVGFLAYRVHTLEGRVFQFEHVRHHLAHAKPHEAARLQRDRRSAESSNASACKDCRDACVKFFGSGSSQPKVSQQGRFNPFTPEFKEYILHTFYREVYKWGSENWWSNNHSTA